MQKSENRFLTMFHDFFLIYLPSQRKSSPHTVKAYQTAVEQLMDYAAGQQECRITAVTFDMLDKNLISGFLDDLERQGCSVSTRNHKLKSIRALFAYASFLLFLTLIIRFPIKKVTSMITFFQKKERLCVFIERYFLILRI